MNQEIIKIQELYDIILSNKNILFEQTQTGTTTIFGTAQVVLDPSNEGVTPPQGWPDGAKYIYKTDGSVFSPVEATVIGLGELRNGKYYLYLESSNKNQVYIGNLTSLSNIRKGQKITKGTELGKIESGTFVYICSSSTPVSQLVGGSSTGAISSDSGGRYNPSGSKTGEYLAKQLSGQSNLKEQDNGRGDSDEGRGGSRNDEGRGGSFSLDNPLGGTMRITSKYGPRGDRFHHGVDISAVSGTEIIAPADGVVTRVESDAPKCGGTIVVKHDNNLKTGYCHVKDIRVTQGENVSRGQVIGITGGGASDPGKGNSKGPHLHYTVRTHDGSSLNPEDYMNGNYTAVGDEPLEPEDPDSESSNSSDESEWKIPTNMAEARVLYEKIKKKIDLSDMSEEERKEALRKLEQVGISGLLIGGAVGLYALVNSIFKKIKKTTQDAAGERYNPSGSKTGDYVGSLVAAILPL